MNLKDKVIWITGSSSGIGAALAKEYADQGAQLILSARNISALEDVRSSCNHPERIKTLGLDLSDCSDIDTKVEQAIGFFGQIDI